MTVYPFIEAERAEQRNVRRACDLLEVSRTAFYQWVQHVPCNRELDDLRLELRAEGPPRSLLSVLHAGHPPRG